jgi:DegV family protein with EDD domain
VIRIVVDSNSQIPPSLVDQFGITVVPLAVTVDGVPYLEGVDLDADDFYARFRSGTPEVATAQPSPGQFGVAYDGLVAAGATEILSVHIGAAVSGTVNAARVAAAEVAVPVRIVDTGTASFGVTLCAWAAAEAVAHGAMIEEAARVAERTAATVRNVFVVRGLELARAGGRLAADATDAAPDAVPVLSIMEGVMHVVGHAAGLDEAADLMAARVCAGGADLRVGVGVADVGVASFWDAMEARLGPASEVREVVRYRVGPSVGAHTGPGTVGVMYAKAY